MKNGEKEKETSKTVEAAIKGDTPHSTDFPPGLQNKTKQNIWSTDGLIVPENIVPDGIRNVSMYLIYFKIF